MTAPAAQLSLDGADRLVARLADRRAPLGMADAASSLFALRGAPPSALVHQLVDEVVRSDHRLVWRSSTEVALTEWEEVATLYDLPLEHAPFVVFDLETTGTRPGVSRIVEIGAVRLQGFDQVGEFERLVDPGVPVPSTITRITGIQTRDLRGAPRIARALPPFLEFAEGAVLVAHNARFDVGFVDAELSRLEGRRLAAPVIDTVALARRLLEGRLPRMNLGTLAERFDTTVRPCHRALADAQATAEVLVHLLGMAQEHGVRTVAEAVAFAAPQRRRVRLRRELARDVPAGPGVYLFHDAHDRVLYVGKATDLRARVRSYFAGSGQRRAVEHALEATARIETRPLGSELEASLLELELILRLRPDANRRSVNPERSCYLTLTTDERVPRVSVTSEPRPGAISAGPLRSRGEAQAAAAAIRSSFRLRSCRPALPEDDGSCLAGLLGRCAAPCRGGAAVQEYARSVAAAAGWLRGEDGGTVASGLRMRMAALGADQPLRGGSPAARPAGGARARAKRAGPAARRGRPQRRAAGGRHGRPLRAGVCVRRRSRGGPAASAPCRRCRARVHAVDRPAADGAGGQAGTASPRPGRRRASDRGGLRAARPQRRGGTAGPRRGGIRRHAHRRAAGPGTLTSMNFADRLAAAVVRKGTSLCVGLDPRIDLLPPELVTGLKAGPAGRARAYERFCMALIESVAEEAVAVKPQVAFFEALGGHGLSALDRICAFASQHDLIVIADAKRGDIASTSQAYAEAWLAPRDGGPPVADAMTVNPYMGGDSLEPFLLACGAGSGLFVLVRTSNPGAADLQEQRLADGRRVWEAHGRAGGRLGCRAGRRVGAFQRRRGDRRDQPRGRRTGTRADAPAGAAATGGGRAGWPRRRSRSGVQGSPGRRPGGGGAVGDLRLA